ncbi:hypothetical protein BH09BAC3_BH09BAC3_01750 [soil metagenome]
MSMAQVLNNNIESKITLTVDNPFFKSTTANSTVQWSCINKVLTDKCVIHHNDQWFDFSITKSGTYFLNVSSQECRDKRGIQVIVIEGDPCKTKNYKVLKCISRVRQEDVFVKMDSLKPGISYLVNIDGFLADQCAFEIQLSKLPYGLPLNFNKPDTVVKALNHGDSIFNLKWHVSKSKVEDLQGFRVYRSMGYFKATIIDEQPVRKNAYGASFQDYGKIDTLNEGDYKYYVFGIQKETMIPQLLMQRDVRYSKALPKLEKDTFVMLNLHYPEKMPFQILVYDLATDKMLRSSKHEFETVRDKNFKVDLSEFLNKGITQFLILASNEKQALEFYFTMNPNGRFIKN